MMREPIAIIGMGCRFPGGVNSAAALWELLCAERTTISEIPADRYDIQAFYDPRPATPGKVMSRWGGFVDQIDYFDPLFFGISPREAERMDPQQRLLLEAAWEAFEDAGQIPNTPQVQQTGVFIGMWLNDFETRLFRNPAKVDFYMTTGSGRYTAPGRLSYIFGLQGPSIAIDSACSSSLVAVHLAVQSLRSGECNLALAGGANVILQPHITIAYSQSRMMAPDGLCKFGDARADGYVRSEGAGVIVLKRLSEALADNDPIYAVIRGSAANNDGRSSGYLTTPGSAGQEEMLRKAYQDAGVSPGAVQYIEAHGTGTVAGDPVEIGAIGAVVGQDRPAGQLCMVGSIKTNLGHTEGAAGIAGLMKVALALKHRMIPASLNYEQPHPGIPWESLPVRVQTALTPWPAAAGEAVGGVSSFGIAGTNAHVVLAEAPVSAAAAAAAAQPGDVYLLPVSASTPEALQAQAGAYRDFLMRTESALPDITYTASQRRTQHEYRLVVTGSAAQELADQLDAYCRSDQRPGMVSGRAGTTHLSGAVFVFPGQGGQWLGMGRDLLEQKPVFREAIARCEAAMRPYVDWSLMEQLSADEAQTRLDEIDVVQPVLFAVQIALAALWRAWGVEPRAVVGHSMGEVTAAYVAGALSLDDAVRVICRRSQLMKRVSGQGAMAVVELSLDDAQALLKGYEDHLSVAVNNGPQSVVLSGDPQALEEIVRHLTAQEIFCRPVNVDVAAHSPHMDALRPELVHSLAELQVQKPSIPIYSTVTGALLTEQPLDAAYWGQNLRQPVRFAAAVEQLVADGYRVFLELGPHPVLLPAIQRSWPDKGLVALPSMRRQEDAQRVVLETLGSLHCAGYPLDWARLAPAGQVVTLPAYAWQRDRFWLEAASQDAYSRSADRPPHPLLGWRLQAADAADRLIYETVISQSSHAHLYASRVEGTVALSPAVYIDWALAAARDAYGEGAYTLTETAVHQALVLSDDQPVTVQLVISTPRGAPQFRIYSQTEARGWTLHASGTIRQGSPALPALEAAARPRNGGPGFSGDDFYSQLAHEGFVFEASGRALDTIWLDGDQAVARLLPQQHTAGAEGGFNLVSALVEGDFSLYVPNYIEEVRSLAPLITPAWAQVRRSSEADGLVQDITLFDEQGSALLAIKGARMQRLEADVVRLEDWAYEMAWQPAALEQDSPAQPLTGRWLIFADEAGVGRALAAQVQFKGGSSLLVYPGAAYARRADGVYLRPDAADDVRRLMDEEFAEHGPACVVHLWSLNSPPADGLTLETLETAQAVGCVSALHVVQAMIRAGWAGGPRLWLVTQGAQPVSGVVSAGAVLPSLLWGFGRVIAEEQRELWGGLVDLSPNADAADAAGWLWQQAHSDDGEDQVAFYNGERYAARLVRAPQAEQALPPLHFRADASYLITGGLGGIALHVARWLVDNGARRLILAGRTPLPPRSAWADADPASLTGQRIAAVRALEAAGASVHLAAVDVADESQLRAFVEAYQREGWPPIRGVMHTAAVIDDRLITQMDSDAFVDVLRPKVIGGWLLHHLLGELDFFVLFSSIGAVLGQTGQASYAAANAFLDGLAYHRHGQGQPALSVNWAGWSDLGLATSAGAQQTIQYLDQQGINSFTPHQGVAALEYLLRRQADGIGAPHAAILPIRWDVLRHARLAASQSRLLADLLAAPGERRADDLSPAGGLLAELQAAKAEQRRKLLETYLQKQVAHVLKLDVARVEPTRPLGMMGVDSLMGLELRNRLEVELGIAFSATLVWNYPTIVEMAPYIADRIGVALVAETGAEARSPSAGQPLADALEDLDDLSDEEALRRLLSE